MIHSCLREKDAIVSIPIDDYGLCVDALEAALLESPHPSLLYIIPTHHNPAGCTLSTRRRAAIVLLARQHCFTIAADEPYHLLTFVDAPEQPRAMRFFDMLTDEQLRTLATQCRDGDEVTAAALVATMTPGDVADLAAPARVVGMGSFSKLLGPGMRCGWLHAAPILINRVLNHGVIDSGGRHHGRGDRAWLASGEGAAVNHRVDTACCSNKQNAAVGEPDTLCLFTIFRESIGQ